VNKLLSLAVAIGISVFCVAATQAMPLAPLEQAQAGWLWNRLSSRSVRRLPSQWLLRWHVLWRSCRRSSARHSGCSGSRGGARPLRWSGLASCLQPVPVLAGLQLICT
jgi:hypothetical protein